MLNDMFKRVFGNWPMYELIREIVNFKNIFYQYRFLQYIQTVFWSIAEWDESEKSYAKLLNDFLMCNFINKKIIIDQFIIVKFQTNKNYIYNDT